MDAPANKPRLRYTVLSGAHLRCFTRFVIIYIRDECYAVLFYPILCDRVRIFTSSGPLCVCGRLVKLGKRHSRFLDGVYNILYNNVM